jgi:hypothetical protein
MDHADSRRTTQVAFYRMNTAEPDGHADLFVVNTDGTGERLVSGIGIDLGTPVPGGRFDIYTVELDGTDLAQLTNTPDATEEFAVWAP